MKTIKIFHRKLKIFHQNRVRRDSLCGRRIFRMVTFWTDLSFLSPSLLPQDYSAMLDTTYSQTFPRTLLVLLYQSSKCILTYKQATIGVLFYKRKNVRYRPRKFCQDEAKCITCQFESQQFMRNHSPQLIDNPNYINSSGCVDFVSLGSFKL